MSVAGHGNCWNTDANGIEEDENLENIFSILDFPMESLEGNVFGDWDVSKSQYLGPIPSNVLMEPLMNIGPSHVSSGPAASIDGAPEPKPVSDHVQGSSGSDILQQSNPPRIQESVFFQTQSPISVLESSGSCSTQKSSPIKSDLAIPVRTRSKRFRASGVNPWLSVAPLLTSASASKKALNVRPYKQRKRSSPLPVVPESNKVPHSLQITFRGVLPAVTKRCSHCEVTKTPQWREGPSGPKTLCNACGVRYRSGRLFPEYRPAASPTFVPTVHSNSHKKVVEMRTKGKHVPGKIYVPPTSPLPEFPEYRPAASPEFVPAIHSNSHKKVVEIPSKGKHVQGKIYVPPTSPLPEFPEYRPAASPEFVPAIHSNSHKKVVEIPNKGKHVPGKIYEPPSSPQPEFIPMSSYLFDYISESGAVSPRV